MNLIRLSLYAALGLLTQCSSCKDADPAPEPLPTLPPETQTGARTFGCLVNGKPFVAKGINQTNGDWLTINSIAIGADTRSTTEEATIHLRIVDNISSGQVYNLQAYPPSGPITTVGFYADATLRGGCDYRGMHIRRGTLTLTHYDPVARIIAGRFAFTLFEPGCDSLRVTDGRFDVQF